MTGEVASFAEADQFPRGKTQFACGFFGCYMAASMAPLGHVPVLTPQQIIDKAEAAYAQYDGDNSISNTDGMSAEQEYELLHQIGLHYQAIALDMSTVKAWVLDGYPVLIALAETSVVDMALGGSPYPWHAAGNHIILVTGVTSDGNVLVRDSANCTNLYDPNSLRPGPRKYNAARIQLVSATVVVPPWKPRPTSANPPQGGDTSMSGIPQNWKDDGHTLMAPNGVPVVLGFRDHILQASSWDSGNTPCESEYHTNSVLLHNASVGAGSAQLFRDCLLWYTQAKGVVQEPFMGLELDAAYKFIAQLTQEIAALKAQTPQPAPVDTTALVSAINAIPDAIAPVVAAALVEAKKL